MHMVCCRSTPIGGRRADDASTTASSPSTPRRRCSRSRGSSGTPARPTSGSSPACRWSSTGARSTSSTTCRASDCSTSTSTAAPTTSATATPRSSPRSPRRCRTSTSATTTSPPSRAPRWPRRWCAPRRPGLTKVVYGSGGGEAIDIALKTARHATQQRKIVSIVKAYHGHTGLAVGTGDERFSKLFLSDRPDEFVARAVQRPRRDGGGAPRPRRRRGDHGDHPGDVRLPAAGRPATSRASSGSASSTARSTSPTRCRPG